MRASCQFGRLGRARKGGHPQEERARAAARRDSLRGLLNTQAELPEALEQLERDMAGMAEAERESMHQRLEAGRQILDMLDGAMGRPEEMPSRSSLTKLDPSMLRLMSKTTSIILGEAFEAFIQEKVASGQYASASEVIREAMRAFQREDEKERAVLSELDRALKSHRAKPGVFQRLRNLCGRMSWTSSSSMPVRRSASCT